MFLKRNHHHHDQNDLAAFLWRHRSERASDGLTAPAAAGQQNGQTWTDRHGRTDRMVKTKPRWDGPNPSSDSQSYCMLLPAHNVIAFVRFSYLLLSRYSYPAIVVVVVYSYRPIAIWALYKRRNFDSMKIEEKNGRTWEFVYVDVYCFYYCSKLVAVSLSSSLLMIGPFTS